MKCLILWINNNKIYFFILFVRFLKLNKNYILYMKKTVYKVIHYKNNVMNIIDMINDYEWKWK